MKKKIVIFGMAFVMLFLAFAFMGANCTPPGLCDDCDEQPCVCVVDNKCEECEEAPCVCEDECPLEKYIADAIETLRAYAYARGEQNFNWFTWSRIMGRIEFTEFSMRMHATNKLDVDGMLKYAKTLIDETSDYDYFAQGSIKVRSLMHSHYIDGRLWFDFSSSPIVSPIKIIDNFNDLLAVSDLYSVVCAELLCNGCLVCKGYPIPKGYPVSHRRCPLSQTMKRVYDEDFFEDKILVVAIVFFLL